MTWGIISVLASLPLLQPATTAAAELLYAVAAAAAAVVVADIVAQEDNSSSGYVLHQHHCTCRPQIGRDRRRVDTVELLNREQIVFTKTSVLHLKSCLSALGWSAAVFTRSYIL